jgi:hypothetical protein
MNGRRNRNQHLLPACCNNLQQLRTRSGHFYLLQSTQQTMDSLIFFWQFQPRSPSLQAERRKGEAHT